MLVRFELTCNSEKQLICMARAILKRAKVLIMDEVASVFSCVNFCDLSSLSI